MWRYTLNSKQITDLLLVIQVTITLLISLRAFYLYTRTGSNAIFSVGLSMGVIALGGITGLLGDTLFASYGINTLWFRYIGQTVSYLFIFLTSLRGSERYFRHLKQWHLIASALLLVLLFVTSLIPTSSNPITLAILSGSRSVVCFAIFLNYAMIFIVKETRFSFLMSLAFLMITFGIWLYTMKFIVTGSVSFDYVGDSIRIAGLVTLLVALFIG
jgi:hypothetical protein